MKPPTRKSVATLAAGAVLVGLGGAGAAAGSVESAQQQPSAGLNVTVGKTVAVTTDQNGQRTPLDMLLINGQVSGQGSGQVNIPLGPKGQKTVEVNNSKGQVQDFFSLGGSYGGDLPVTVSTQVSVDGKTIDPNQGFNLTGDVEVTYTFVNHTARQQTISYRNIYGKTVSKQTEVPVPFGDSFAVTFGDGWSVQDPGGMAMSTTPQGAALTSTVILFPIIDGVVGGTTQTLKIKARAEAAALPATKSTIVPVPLGTYFNGLALEVEPALQQQALAPLNSVLDGVLGDITSVGNIISGYTGGFQSLATNYIDPLVSQVDSIKVSPSGLTNKFDQLASGLNAVAGLMAANQAAQDRIGGVFDDLGKTVGVSGVKLVKWLGKVVEEAGPGSREAAKGLRALSALLNSLDLGSLQSNQAVVDQACSVVGPTSDYYGYAGSLLFPKGAPGAAALKKVISDNTPLIGKPPAWVKTLQQLQTQLNSQAAGTLIPSTAYLALLNYAKKAIPPEVLKILTDPACSTVGTLTDSVVVPVANAWAAIGPQVPTVAAALEAFADFAGSPAAKHLYNGTLKALQEVSKLLSNGNCSTSDLIDPLISAIKRYGAAGIKAHIGSVLEQVFSNCGLAQVIRFLGQLDGLIGVAMAKLGGLINSAKADIPTIVGGVDKVKGLTNIAGEAFDAIPGLGRYVADLIGTETSKYGGMGEDAIGKVSSYAAELQAMLLAMNARGEAGDGAPYGNATGPNTHTLAAYQITQQEAGPYAKTWTTAAILAVLFLVIAVGVGTVLYRRRRRSGL